MREFISSLLLVFILLFFVIGSASIVQNIALSEIQFEYCKQHSETSLEEYKLCKADLVTFFKRKINNDR